MLEILKQIDLKKLFDLDRVFEIDPAPEGLYIYLAFPFGLLLLAALALAILAPRKSKMYQKLLVKWAYLFLTTGLICEAVIFFRYQGIVYLGSRVVLYLLFLLFMLWALSICLYWFVAIPKEKKLLQDKKNFEKYLPQGKKGS